MIYKVYTGTEPPPAWLKVIGSIAMTALMVGFAAGGWVWLVVTRPDGKSP